MIRLIRITGMILTLFSALGGGVSVLAEEEVARGKLLQVLQEEDQSLDGLGLKESHPLRLKLRKVMIGLEKNGGDDASLVLEEDEPEVEGVDPAKPRGVEVFRTKVAPYAVLITLPNYQQAKKNRLVEIEVFEFLRDLRGDRKYHTLLFKDRAILAFCSQEDVYDFHVKFRGEFHYGLQSGKSRNILEIWKGL